MRSKLCEFERALLCSGYDVIVIVETWLNDSVNNVELGLLPYNVFRLDRNMNTISKSRGGGVLIADKKYIFVVE